MRDKKPETNIGNETINWLKEGLGLTNMALKESKIRLAKRFKAEGVELNFGTGDSPISISYKDQRIDFGTKVGELCKHIDKETWDSVTTPKT